MVSVLHIRICDHRLFRGMPPGRHRGRRWRNAQASIVHLLEFEFRAVVALVIVIRFNFIRAEVAFELDLRIMLEFQLSCASTLRD